MSKLYNGETHRSVSRIHDMRLQQFFRENCPCNRSCMGRSSTCRSTCEDNEAFQEKLKAFRAELAKERNSKATYLEVRYDKKAKREALND